MKGNEAEYIIPLRKEIMKVAKYHRAKKTIIAIRQFLQKHTKSENVLLGKELNQKIQSRGRKYILSKVHVKVLKDEDKYRAELIGFPIEPPKKEEPKSKKAKEEKPKKEAEKIIETKELKKETMKEVTVTKELPKEKAEKVRKEKMVVKDEKPTNEKKK